MLLHKQNIFPITVGGTHVAIFVTAAMNIYITYHEVADVTKEISSQNPCLTKNNLYYKLSTLNAFLFVLPGTWV